MAQFTVDPRSIEDAHVLTRLITKELHEDTEIGEKIAPLRTVTSRKIQVKTRQFNPAGIGQFKSINGNTPIRAGGGRVTSEYMELVDLEEKEVLRADDILALASIDDRVAADAARNVVEIGRELAIRNRNLTRWMRWKAFQDALTFTFHDGTSVAVQYQLGNEDSGMTYAHVQELLTTAKWNAPTTADPLGNVQDWSDYIATDLGVDGAWLIMNRKTFRILQKVDQIEAYLMEHYGPLKIPNAEAMAEIFDLKSAGGGILVENGYWEDTDGTKNRYIPDGYVLMTAPWVVDSAPIAEVYDGPVVMVQGNDLVAAPNPGLQAEMYIEAESKTKSIRLATARMVWLRREAFIWAKVY